MTKRLKVEIQEYEREQIRRLTEMLEENNLTEIEIKIGQDSVRIQRVADNNNGK